MTVGVCVQRLESENPKELGKVQNKEIKYYKIEVEIISYNGAAKKVSI